MIIAIDSSHQMTYTGILSCNSSDFKKFREELTKICNRVRINNQHWSKLTNKEKAVFAPHFVSLVNRSNLHFTIISHKRPPNKERKEYFMEDVTQLIAKLLNSWFMKPSKFIVLCDDDYNLKNMRTEDFIEKIFKKYAQLETGEIVAPRNNNKSVRMTIKTNFGHYELSGFVKDIRSSEEIWVIDNFLGCYLFNGDNRQLKWDRNKVYFKKV